MKTVIELKMNGASSEYRTLKLMGDAYLKPLVYQHILRERKYVDDMEDKALCVLSNRADSAMPLFYDSHVRLLHDEMILAEKGVISSHGKSDVIEAILEHCRLELETEALKFLISTLFKSLKYQLLPIHQLDGFLHSEALCQFCYDLFSCCNHSLRHISVLYILVIRMLKEPLSCVFNT